MLNIKSNLLKVYKEKLQAAKKKPKSSPSYNRTINNLNQKIENIKLGDYIPNKTDLRDVKKITSNTRTVTKINKAINSFDTDGESFFIWNSADRKSKYADGGIDLAITVQFRTDKGDTMYRHYGIISNRFDNAVTDKMIHNEILYNSKIQDNSYQVLTQSDITINIVSYQIIWAGRN